MNFLGWDVNKGKIFRDKIVVNAMRIAHKVVKWVLDIRTSLFESCPKSSSRVFDELCVLQKASRLARKYREDIEFFILC